MSKSVYGILFLVIWLLCNGIVLFSINKWNEHCIDQFADSFAWGKPEPPSLLREQGRMIGKGLSSNYSFFLGFSTPSIEEKHKEYFDRYDWSLTKQISGDWMFLFLLIVSTVSAYLMVVIYHNIYPSFIEQVESKKIKEIQPSDHTKYMPNN